MSPLAVVLIVSGLAVAAVITLAIWLMDRDDRGDPFAQSGLVVDAATVMDMTMPPEIAHDDPFTPLTSVAHPPAGIPPDRPTGPRAAAAAGLLPAPATPPPLPSPWQAAYHPETVPFHVWEDDDLVQAVNDLKGGMP